MQCYRRYILHWYFTRSRFAEVIFAIKSLDSMVFKVTYKISLDGKLQYLIHLHFPVFQISITSAGVLSYDMPCCTGILRFMELLFLFIQLLFHRFAVRETLLLPNSDSRKSFETL